MPNVTIIPATKNIHTKQPANAHVKRRVAGYARVSTDSDEQFTSYEAQIDYYTQFITAHADWTFVEVYTDEGISGLNTKNREGFNRMITDALAGRIDLIVTKSVSRFARNVSRLIIPSPKGLSCSYSNRERNSQARIRWIGWHRLLSVQKSGDAAHVGETQFLHRRILRFRQVGR